MDFKFIENVDVIAEGLNFFLVAFPLLSCADDVRLNTEFGSSHLIKEADHLADKLRPVVREVLKCISLSDEDKLLKNILDRPIVEYLPHKSCGRWYDSKFGKTIREEFKKCGYDRLFNLESKPNVYFKGSLTMTDLPLGCLMSLDWRILKNWKLGQVQIKRINVVLDGLGLKLGMDLNPLLRLMYTPGMLSIYWITQFYNYYRTSW